MLTNSVIWFNVGGNFFDRNMNIGLTQSHVKPAKAMVTSHSMCQILSLHIPVAVFAEVYPAQVHIHREVLATKSWENMYHTWAIWMRACQLLRRSEAEGSMMTSLVLLSFDSGKSTRTWKNSSISLIMCNLNKNKHTHIPCVRENTVSQSNSLK